MRRYQGESSGCIRSLDRQPQRNRQLQQEDEQQLITIAKWEAASPRAVAVKSSSSSVNALNMESLLVVVPANVAANL
jgi:hypothetical protein